MTKKIFVIICATLMSLGAYAQQSLAGRVYYNGNLMEKELSQTKKEMANLSKEAESEEEKEEVKGMDAILNAVVSKMTLTFIDDKTAEIHIEAKFDEDKAKKEGASWMMRKLVKMKIGKGRSEKGKTSYTVNGRKVLVKASKKKETRTFDLSEDGKTLSFVMKDKKEERKVVLKRIK